MNKTVADILKLIDSIAPFETAMDFDNVGLLIGEANSIVKGIIYCLDCTIKVVDRAKQIGANLIIAHHPLIFGGIDNILLSDNKGRIIKELLTNDINLISAHTNLDSAEKGIGYALAHTLGLNNIVSDTNDKFLFIGSLNKPMNMQSFIEHVQNKLNCIARPYANSNKLISRVAVSPGAGGESYLLAYQSGADVFISGEIKHHHIMECCALNMSCIDVGHFNSEFPGMLLLMETLKPFINKIETDIFTNSICININ